jgi:hypothetical protein
MIGVTKLIPVTPSRLLIGAAKLRDTHRMTDAITQIPDTNSRS